MKILLWVFGSAVTLLAAAGLAFATYFGFLFAEIDTVPPQLPSEVLDNTGAPAVLVFSKANGFVHEEALPAGSRVLAEIAKKKGWVLFETQNGAVMNPDQLQYFDVVVWHNTSGTTLSDEQAEAFQTWLQNGGGFVGLHAAGGDFYYHWDWYVNHLIGAQFVGHTMDPQFQDAVVLNQQNNTGITAHLPDEWPLALEEWYAFDRNPRDTGSTILLTLDENSYAPGAASMAGEHPIAWAHEIGQGEEKGRVVYSAIGHQAHTYERADYQEMITRAVVWAGRLPGERAFAMDDGTAQGTAKRWLQQAGDAISSAYDVTKEAASDAYDATSDAAVDAYEAVKEEVSPEEN